MIRNVSVLSLTMQVSIPCWSSPKNACLTND